MAPLPKKKHTRARTGKRREGQKKLTLPNLIACSNCKKLRQFHQACPYCGFYKNK